MRQLVREIDARAPKPKRGPYKTNKKTEHFNLGHYLYARVFVCASRRDGGLKAQVF